MTGAGVIATLLFFRQVLTPFALAIIIAYVLAPVVEQLERLSVRGWHLPRWGAVVILFVALLGGLGASIAFGAPRILVEFTRAARETPRAVHSLQEEWLPRIEDALRGAAALYPSEPRSAAGSEVPLADDDDEVGLEVAPEPGGIRVVPGGDGSFEIRLPPDGIEIVKTSNGQYRVRVDRGEHPTRRDLGAFVADTVREFFSDFEAYAGTALRGAQVLLGRLVGGIFSFFIMMMLAAYLLITSDRILCFFRSMARPDRQDSFDALVERVDRGLAGVVRGQLMIALVNGALSAVGFWIADLPYWPILTLIATLLSIIPIFGAIISSVPAVLVGLQQGVGTAAFVLVWIIGIHQIEANLLNPKIMGDAAKVHPVLVVFALLAGEHAFGIVGALLAVPLLSITQSLFLHWREIALGVPKHGGLATAPDGGSGEEE